MDQKKLKKLRNIERKKGLKFKKEYCEKCLIFFDKKQLQLHHIKKLSDGGRFLKDGIITLCVYCHNKEHGITTTKKIKGCKSIFSLPQSCIKQIERSA